MKGNPTILEMVRWYLKKYKYDGLCNTDCGCQLPDIMPCQDTEISTDCQAGYKCKIKHREITTGRKKIGCAQGCVLLKKHNKKCPIEEGIADDIVGVF